ncbi:MAG: sulfatase-like hydrolase/transferase [Alphaproteobacteria bacterium]|nr:sulfatase-like hydrolase/transferase [Alphaproteobacteria bacterium]
MQPKNMLVLMSDEHNKKILGCHGNAQAITPNIDALAACGTRFTNAYCNSPICIPARATFATGQYINQIGYWDNADPYEGTVPSWHHRLRDTGHEAVSIGKLHFRSDDDDNGFSESQLAMHVVEGLGDLMGLVREDLPVRGGAYKIARSAGPGESEYTAYDRDITMAAVQWLKDAAARSHDKPWTLFVSWVCPHFPLTAPQAFYDLYDPDALPWPKLYGADERPDHPYVRDYAGSCNYDDHFEGEEHVRRAVASYYALCSFLDDNIGQVLAALVDAGLADDTNVMYTSDHGDNLGSRGLWGKSMMYEEAAAVPMILAGPDVPAGVVRDAPVTHVDCYPTFMECAGEPLNEAERAYPGQSLFGLANGEEPDRTILSEYHAMGSTTGAFMIREGQYKYVHYVGYPPQLFDLAADPEELVDLGTDPAHAEIRATCDAKLRAVCDPEDVDTRCKARQGSQLARNGGRNAVITRGDLGYSPPPGLPVDFR